MTKTKFRAWDKDDKIMAPVFGLEFDDVELIKVEILFPGDEETSLRFPMQVVLMQYTGLKDKNGKEIYEGDIFDVTDRHDDYIIYARVVWDDDECYWGYQKDDGDDTECGQLTQADFDVSKLEVIGNIYENPKLLKI